MRSFTVKNEKGQSFEVDSEKLHEAEADGYLPVVTNGTQEHRVASKDFGLAEKDGYKPVMSSDMSSGEASVRGAVQGLPFVGSYADEATGLAESAAGSLGLVPDKTYQQARDESRRAYKEAEEFHPAPYYGAMTAVNLPIDTARVVPVLGQALGSVEGGVYGLGASEADLTKGEVGRAAVDTGLGAALGFVVPKVLKAAGEKVISPVVQKGLKVAEPYVARTVNKLKDMAGKFAENATGATGHQLSKFEEGAGRELLKRGLVKFGDDPEKIAMRAGEAKRAAGQAISDALQELDNRGVTASRDNIRNVLEDKIADLQKVDGNEEIVASLQKEVDRLYDKTLDILKNDVTGSSRIPLSEAEQAKRNFQGKTNYFSPVADQKSSFHTADAYRKEVEQAAEAADPNISKTFQSAKETYGLLSPIEEAAQKRANQLNQHPLGGLNDMAAAGVGAVTQGLSGAMVTTPARRLIAPRISSSLAVSSDRLANVIERAPEKLGKYADVLSKALGRGGNALGVTHYLLQSTDPEYQKLMQEDESFHDE